MEVLEAGAEWKKPMEMEQRGGRWCRQLGEDRANCTLLPAGRFLVGVDGKAWGIHRPASGLLHSHRTAHGAGGQTNSVHPTEIGPQKCWNGVSQDSSPPSTGTHDPRLAHTSWKVPPCADLAVVPGSRGVGISSHRGLCLGAGDTFFWSSLEVQNGVRQQHRVSYTHSDMLRFSSQIWPPTLLGGHQEPFLLKRKRRRGQ